MNDFVEQLRSDLDRLRAAGLWRQLRRVDSPQGTRLRIGGEELLNFSSNDYLGLANHPAIRVAAAQAVERFGAGAGASRLICGSMGPHHELDEALAAFKGTDAALSFSSGFATALGTVPALVGAGDVVAIDKRVHASLVDAARLSGATLRVFKHNDLDSLESILRWAAASPPAPPPSPSRRRRILIVTESVFSMEGEPAPLREMVALKERYGAWLLLDEAHATGLFGKHRRGLAEQLGIATQIEVQMGTLGKALGASGGYICGSRVLIEWLVHRARSFVFSTAPVPAAAAAATAAIQIVGSAEGTARCATLWDRVAGLRQALQTARYPIPETPHPILPLILGDETRAVQFADALRERGFFVPAIRYPTVARGAARLRLTLSASHTAEQIASLGQALAELRDRISIRLFKQSGTPPAADSSSHAPAGPA